MFARVSLPGQTPTTRRVAPEPETRTPEKPRSRNFCAIIALSANCSIDVRARVARYRFPWWTVNSPAKLEALRKVAAMAKTARAVSELRRVLLVMANLLLVLPLKPTPRSIMDIFVEEEGLTPSEPPIHVAFKAPAAPAFRASRLAAQDVRNKPLGSYMLGGNQKDEAWVC
jgi:hypothetical protein